MILDAWPAFRIARDHLNSPSLFAETRLRLAEELVDAFSSESLPASADIAAFLLEFFDGELDLALEDQSEQVIARDLLLLWGTPHGPARDGLLQRIAQSARAAPTSYQREVTETLTDGEEDVEGSGEEGSDGLPQMEVDTPAKASKAEPVIDEEGFTLVRRKR